ncbi:uracil-DNA glycosylase [Buchnera aphidicola]|uniref:uracil-DNA glycosylase n=1 Tax=Buchnera aphidicola TaxID=9 RepID=UPI0021C6B725
MKQQRLKKNIYPKVKDIFNAFKFTPFYGIKIVIIGQDPYHNRNQAHGLAFSVCSKCTIIPPSLKNIFKEIYNDLKKKSLFTNGCLIPWAKQGILLLNTILTVEENKPMSHANVGWEIFTDQIVSNINKLKKNIIFILWGSFAKKKLPLINKKKHFILTSSHPSPLSAHRGFIGCNHFSKTNKILLKIKKKIIVW